MADLVLGIRIAVVFGSVVEQDIDRAERVDGGDCASLDPSRSRPRGPEH
ncbi:MAG TPA: hypothetical protein VN327_10405 [Pseudonocardiaceae bacterium]|jgi:hypothetical protein|nr:hypothetical protein [Pseudonocardiaceae bacterium]